MNFSWYHNKKSLLCLPRNNDDSFFMKAHCLHIVFLFSNFLILCHVQGQENPDQKLRQGIEKSNAMLDNFSRKCERRTKKAERRFERYERKIDAKITKNTKITGIKQDSLRFIGVQKSQESRNGLGKEPLLDSLRLIYGFADYTGISPEQPLTGKANESLNHAQQQLNVTQRTKNELLQRKEYWKEQAKEHTECGKWLGKMEKERYYYTAQINEYRKPLRDPNALDEKLMNALRKDPRWAEFAATLPAKPQNPDKMQPRKMVQQMIQTQATAIDPDPASLLRDAKKKGNDLLGNLTNQASSFGNMDNSAQMPKFTPNPYKTKSFWNRIDVGFNLQFDNRTNSLPSAGVAGAQASFNFNPKFSVGVLTNYRFGMGEITNIHFSHAGAGYGTFANYKVWKGIGVQAGYERNWRAEMLVRENRYPAAWTNSALAGFAYEYGIGKKAKASVGVFYDFLYRQHTPQTNAVLWRMGWKM